jgi:hypothetical protein
LVLVLVLDVVVDVVVDVVLDVVVEWTAVRAARAAYPIVRRPRRGSDEEAAAGAGPCAGTGSA